MTSPASSPAPRPVAIVTGSQQGIGLAAAQQLSDHGFNIAMLDLPARDALSPQALTLLATPARQHRYYQLDIAQIERHQAVLDAIWRDYARLDCLVNNAGIAARPLTDLLDLSPQAFDRSVDINLRGTFFLTQGFAKLLLANTANASNTADAASQAEAAYRSIIFITSIAAGMVSTERAQYCITKAALSMTSQLFAVRLAAHGIHVHEIRPGFIRTAMTASLGRTAVDEWIENGRVPLARWGQPSDIATAISTLARGHMPYMSGAALHISGGVDIPQAT